MIDNEMFSTLEQLRSFTVDSDSFKLENPARPYDNDGLLRFFSRTSHVIAAYLRSQNKPVHPDADANSKRVAHALKRLKEQNLWAGNLDGVEKKLATYTAEGTLIGPAALSVHRLLFAPALDGIDPVQVELTDQLWCMGIELTIIQTDPTLLRTPDRKYALSLKEHLVALYINMLFLGQMTAMLDALMYYQESSDAMEQFRGRLDEVKNIIEENKTLREQVDTLANKTAEQAAGFERAKRGYEKHILHLEHDVNLLTAGQSVNAGETDDDFDIEEALDSDDEFDEGVPEENADGKELAVLPETGVLFAGGHWNMLKRLKARHPYWTYQAGKQGLRIPATTQYIFIWAKHFTHPQFNSIKAQLSSTNLKHIRVAYVEGTNMEKLEHNMREKLTSLLEKP